jgi:hypothetical protein
LSLRDCGRAPRQSGRNAPTLLLLRQIGGHQRPADDRQQQICLDDRLDGDRHVEPGERAHGAGRTGGRFQCIVGARQVNQQGVLPVAHRAAEQRCAGERRGESRLLPRQPQIHRRLRHRSQPAHHGAVVGKPERAAAAGGAKPKRRRLLVGGSRCGIGLPAHHCRALCVKLHQRAVVGGGKERFAGGGGEEQRRADILLAGGAPDAIPGGAVQRAEHAMFIHDVDRVCSDRSRGAHRRRQIGAPAQGAGGRVQRIDLGGIATEVDDAVAHDRLRFDGVLGGKDPAQRAVGPAPGRAPRHRPRRR